MGKSGEKMCLFSQKPDDLFVSIGWLVSGYVELQAEQILTGSRADLSEKVGAESRADTKLLQFFAFFAVFMPFLYR